MWRKLLERNTRALTAQSVQYARPTTPSAAPFPIVGIGASAGGLEAIEQFLGGVPTDCGMAFVVVHGPARLG